MQFLLFLCRPHNLRILQPKEDNYSDNCSGRAREDDDLCKDDDSRDWMGGSVWSKTQKEHRVHQLECSYASFMLSLRYYLCLFCINYASTKNQCYVVSCSSVYILPSQRRGKIQAIGWEIRSCHHFGRSR